MAATIPTPSGWGAPRQLAGSQSTDLLQPVLHSAMWEAQESCLQMSTRGPMNR